MNTNQHSELFRLLQMLFDDMKDLRVSDHPHFFDVSASPLAVSSFLDRLDILVRQCQDDQGFHKDVVSLYRAGYALEHILLLADAPLEADRGSALRSRAELLDLWNKENGFRPEVDPLDRVVNAAPSVLALGAMTGLAFTLPVFLAGLVLRDPDLVALANGIGQLLPSPGAPIQAVLAEPDLTNLAVVGGSAVGVSISVFQSWSDVRDQAGRLQLRAVVSGAGRPAAETRACLEELDQMPTTWHHLLAHLDPREMVLFLQSDDPQRRQILSVRPPSMPQRLAQAGSLPERGIWGRMQAAYLERPAPWEGPGEFRPGLPRAISGLRGRGDS